MKEHQHAEWKESWRDDCLKWICGFANAEYRSGSTTQELKGPALERFMNRKHGRTWDGAPWPGVSVRELSKPAIDTFRKAARQSARVEPSVLRESVTELIEKLHLMEGKYLKRAALFLFHDQPEQFATGAYVKVGFFRTDNSLAYHDEIHGDLFTQVGKTVELVRTKYLKAGIRYEGIQRIETYPVTYGALREAVLNAVIHKDYASGATIQISVYADKLMIWNPGQLPPLWGLAKLKGKHSSQPLNPDIANAFFRAGEIEAWGQGIDLMFAECREAGFPEPVLEYEQSGLWVTFPFAPEIVALTGEGGGKRTVEKTPGKTPDRIFELLRANPDLTVPEIAAELSKSESAVIRAIQRLQAAGRVRRVGSLKAGHWEVLP